jgi:hypothetical protein
MRHLGLPRFRALHAGGKTPTSYLVSYYLHSGYNAPQAIRSRGGRRRSGLPRLRVQTPLYRRGSGYRLGGRLSGCWLLRGCIFGMIFWPLLCPHLTIALYKAPFPPWTGIWEAYALPFASDPFMGKALARWLVESGCGLRHARPSPLSILSGARPLSAKQPLEESSLHRPALALLSGVASRLLAQPALRAEPVFLS